MLPTLADAAGVDVPASLGVDGHSFAPVLRGQPGSRQWVYCWYFRNGKPVGGGQRHKAGEYARDHRYKLYREDGLFYDVPTDFYEKNPLATENLTPAQKQVRDRLGSVINEHTRKGFYKTKRDAEGKSR